jgi:type III secretion system IpaD/SipD/SspD family effector
MPINNVSQGRAPIARVDLPNESLIQGIHDEAVAAPNLERAKTALDQLQETLEKSMRASGEDAQKLRDTASQGLLRLLKKPEIRALMAQTATSDLRASIKDVLAKSDIPLPKSVDPDYMNEGELADWMADIISDTQTGYLDVYTDIARKYTEFYKKISTISYTNYIVVDDSDPNNVKFDAGALYADLKNVLDTHAEVLAGFDDKESADVWAKRIYGDPPPAGTVKEVIDPATGKKSYLLCADTTPLNSMMAELEKLAGKSLDGVGSSVVKVSTIKFNAWEQNYKTQVSTIENMIQQLGNQMSSATSKMDNLIKVMMSCLSMMFEACKKIADNF